MNFENHGIKSLRTTRLALTRDIITRFLQYSLSKF